MFSLKSALVTSLFGILLHILIFKFIMEPNPTTLADYDFAFNSEGQLRKIDESGLPGEERFKFTISSDHGKNQKHYEEIGEAVTEYVYTLLEEEGLVKLPVPVDETKAHLRTFVFATKGALEQPAKLLILIHGSGVVRAGQWARSLIINDSLRTGSQLEYIRRAVRNGYEVIVTNTNDNYRNVADKILPIPESETPEQHLQCVWDNYVIKSNAERVFIVAHSYGGVVTVHLAKNNFAEFVKRVVAVALTDSVHSYQKDGSDHGMAHVTTFLKTIGRNWVSSNEPLDTPEPTKENDNDIQKVSAGTVKAKKTNSRVKKHEMTSSSAIDSVFKFLNDQNVGQLVGQLTDQAPQIPASYDTNLTE